MLKILAITGIIQMAFSVVVYGQKVKARIENQFSGWATMNFSDPLKYQFGGRYIPTFSFSDSLNNNRKLDAELSFNTYGNLFFEGNKYDDADKSLKPYRCWIRYTGSRFEIRAGLQKLNFGSATILRPLMWFDKMDSRDPLQLTDGVYSLLGRYYFQSNANIWLWALYGNKKNKGWELVPTQENSLEYGGRFQLPVPKGEVAVSFHSRKADFSELFKSYPQVAQTKFEEDKVGFDGKWDIEIGLSVEYVIKYNDPDNNLTNKWETYTNVGLDYTFQAGNGLNLATEFFRYANKQEWNKKGTDNNYSVLLIKYPLGLMNTIIAMAYYNWDQKEWFRFISLQRKYDYWSFYLMAFWNPEEFSLYSSSQGRSLFAGKGIQFMAVVNF